MKKITTNTKIFITGAVMSALGLVIIFATLIPLYSCVSESSSCMGDAGFGVAEDAVRAGVFLTIGSLPVSIVMVVVRKLAMHFTKKE